MVQKSRAIAEGLIHDLGIHCILGAVVDRGEQGADCYQLRVMPPRKARKGAAKWWFRSQKSAKKILGELFSSLPDAGFDARREILTCRDSSLPAIGDAVERLSRLNGIAMIPAPVFEATIGDLVGKIDAVLSETMLRTLNQRYRQERIMETCSLSYDAWLLRRFISMPDFGTNLVFLKDLGF